MDDFDFAVQKRKRELAVLEAAKAWADAKARHDDETLVSSALFDAVEALEKAEAGDD